MTSIIFSQLASLFLIMIAGYFFTRLGIINATVIKGMSGLLTKLMLPALVLGSMQIPYSSERAGTMGLAAAGMAVTILVGAAVAWVFLRGFKSVSKSEAGVWMCVCAFPNALYIGKPLMEALYGSSILFIISAMSIVFNVLCFSVGVYLVTMGRETGSGGARTFLKSLVNPTLIAGVIGVIMYFSSISLPSPVISSMNMLSSMTTPVSMLIIGYSLVGVKLKELLLDWRIYVLSALRLVICPAILYVVMRLFIHEEMLLNVMLVSALLPIATMTGVISEQHDNPHKELCSKGIVVSTVLSLATVPVMFSILRSF